MNAGNPFDTVTASSIGTSGSPKVVNLGALASNGGPTLTHALLATSPELAINMGSNSDASSLTSDQRGFTPRIVNTTVDIGAYEVGAVDSSAVPEIDVKGNSTSIASGDITPSATDNTDFGSANVTGGTVVKTYTIENTGTGALTLSGTPKVAVSGTNAADFSVTTQPTSPVAAGGSATFQVTFDPSTAGVRTATLTIANDDANEGTYTFAISGVGTVPDTWRPAGLGADGRAFNETWFASALVGWPWETTA